MNVSDQGFAGQPFLQIPRVIQIRRTLLILWGAMIVSMGWVSYVLFHSLPEAPIKSPVAPFIALLLAFLSFSLPDWLIRRIRPAPPNNTMDTRLGLLLINHILRFALTEGALLLALLSNTHPGPMSAGCFYGVALGLMVIHYPTDSRILSLAGA
jgi:hypothetical protein